MSSIAGSGTVARRSALALVAAMVVVCVGCGATTNSRIAFSEEALRSPSDAIVYVYRMKNMVGAVAPWTVRIDGVDMGQQTHPQALWATSLNSAGQGGSRLVPPVVPRAPSAAAAEQHDVSAPR